MKEIPHRRSDFTRRRRISLAKQISQIPKGIYFVEKKPPFSIFREVWLRQVKQRRCRCEASCCARCEVKCSYSCRAEGTLHARSALHLRSILHVPRKRNTSIEKAHICLSDKCGLFRGGRYRTLPRAKKHATGMFFALCGAPPCKVNCRFAARGGGLDHSRPASTKKISRATRRD